MHVWVKFSILPVETKEYPKLITLKLHRFLNVSHWWLINNQSEHSRFPEFWISDNSRTPEIMEIWSSRNHKYFTFHNHICSFTWLFKYSLFGRHICFFPFMPITFEIVHMCIYTQCLCIWGLTWQSQVFVSHSFLSHIHPSTHP